jgi:hypothetical protein
VNDARLTPSTRALSLVLLLLVFGCGKRPLERSEIGGQVTLDGKLLKEGSILFTPMAGTKGTVAGGRIENGRYRLSAANGPAIGWNSVTINAARKTGKKLPQSLGSQNGKPVDAVVEAVAPRFNSDTILKVNIEPGTNTADFAVESQ